VRRVIIHVYSPASHVVNQGVADPFVLGLNPMSRPVAHAVVVLILVVLPCWMGSASAEGTTGREAMADAMSRMMEAMGLMGTGGNRGAAGIEGPLGQAAETARGMMEGAARGVPGAGTSPFSDGSLNGIWEAAGGGLLIVAGGNYRLYAPNWAFVDGILQVAGGRIRMMSRRAGFSLEFEYALDQGRLAMRDSNGQVYLYRRMVLDGGD
jgi:hypothetical protein